MKKKLSFLLALLVMVVTGAWADTVVLTTPSESVTTLSDANGIVTITDASGSTGVQQGSGSYKMTYDGTDYVPMKLSGSRNFTLSYKEGVTISKVTLLAMSNGDAEGTVGAGDGDATSLGTFPARNADKNCLTVDITDKKGLRANRQWLALIVVEYSTTEPGLTATPNALTFALNPSVTSKTQTFTITGQNLMNGVYDLTIPNVDGLTVSPTSFEVENEVVNQEVQVTYASTADVAKAETTIGVAVGELSANVAVSYQSRATAYTQSTVSTAAAWDWSKLTETVELTDESTPTKSEEFLLADLDDRISFTEGFGDAKAIKMEAMQFPSRAGFAQGTYIKFKTSVAGKISVDFSNTGGGDRPNRYLNVNGVNTEFASNTSDKVSATDIAVPAGEVVLMGNMQDATDATVFTPNMLRWYKITFTPTEEPAPVSDADFVYDFAAEQALIAAGTVAKPGNVGGNQNNGQGFNAYGVKIRNDYKGYSKKEGSTLPDVCHIWRRSDRFDQDASWNVAGGVAMPNNREFAIDGLTPGSKVVIEYDATNCNDDSKNIIWAVGENDKLGAAVGAGEGIPVATATIGGVEAVPGETAIASGAEILVKSVTPAVKGTGYIVVQVKKNMVISKISILVNEDAVDYAVNVSESIENGTVKVNRTTAYEGDDVYVTATPAEGYALESITVKGADETEIAVTDGKFTMPAQAVTVSATFKEIPKLYIIGDMNGWNRTAMTEMTFNAETQAYEYEYAPTTVAHLAFADYQMTEDEAAAEGSWDVFNSTYRYSLGRASDTDPNVKVSPSETALTLIKGVEGTIELNPGTYKISVAKDFSTVTITGEAAPEALVCIVAGNNPEIFGTPWDETNEANKMTKGADGKYSKTYTVTDAVKDIQLKIVTDGTWYGDATGNNVTFDMTAAGEFTVVFDPATKEVSVTGDNVKFPTDFDYTDVYAVGNGSEGWLNNKAWVPGAEENKMTKVSDGIFEITFNEVPAGENRQVKFAIDGTWDRNFGGTFAAFGEETAAVYDGGNITFNTTADLPKITIRLDLTGFDFATKQGAKFTISAASSTGINAVKADALKDAQIYTISGQRVDKAQKGLYIVNGKKVVVK